eukprot:6208041-Pleurochrysis_carterae.AAC.5
MRQARVAREVCMFTIGHSKKSAWRLCIAVPFQLHQRPEALEMVKNQSQRAWSSSRPWPNLNAKLLCSCALRLVLLAPLQPNAHACERVRVLVRARVRRCAHAGTCQFMRTFIDAYAYSCIRILLHTHIYAHTYSRILAFMQTRMHAYARDHG